MRGDIAVSFTVPEEIDRLINKMVRKKGVSRREIIIQAVKLLAENKADV